MEQEIWVPVYPALDKKGLFQVSSFGKIKRLGYFTKKGKWRPELIRKISMAGKYPRFTIGGVTVSVHRIVCISFHPNPENKPQVNHKDNNKKNNRADNLEWCTQPENIQHAQSIGVMPYAKPKPPKLPRKKVAPRYKKIIDINTGEMFNSINELCEIKNLKFKNTRRQLSGQRYCYFQYRYLGEESKIKIPPVKVKKEPPVKKERPPKKEYIPHPLPVKKVLMFDINGNELHKFNSSKEAANHIGTKKETFKRWINSTNTNYHKGYIFRYA